MEIEFSMSDFAQQLRYENADVPDLYFYFTLFDAAGISPNLVLNEIPKQSQKREENGVLFKTGMSDTAKLYTHGFAVDGSVRNLVKASNLPVSKVRQLLHSKP